MQTLIKQLEIDKLKLHLTDEFLEYGIKNLLSKKNLIRDYIFMCFILGNDFIPHSDSLSIRENGINILIQTYVSVILCAHRCSIPR